ncbi:hypothetical protein [Kutzneria buriramensis]|uniref:Uncharacterized protein n=1 Tax=Kutzneria buriramensis TaxID=1045776 RepID=A0A3E0HEE5_9PSEU|nr:hypothetical protein [Kutzneria buriramensis]REH43612.1 hypothetical protein BCF44_109155 [Kutzneria buriramensis]
MTGPNGVVPAELRHRHLELLARRASAASDTAVAEIEDEIAVVCDQLADALYPHDELLGGLALHAAEYWRDRAAETRGRFEAGGAQ